MVKETIENNLVGSFCFYDNVCFMTCRMTKKKPPKLEFMMKISMEHSVVHFFPYKLFYLFHVSLFHWQPTYWRQIENNFSSFCSHIWESLNKCSPYDYVRFIKASI